MAEAEAEAGDVRDDAPNPMVLMGDILEKLKILRYEEFARKHLDGRLLHAAYFVVPHPKPNEQFHYFTQLFAFLMKLNKFSFEAPDEFDDPNSTVANMMEALRRARIPFDYSQAKVRAGHGEAVCVVLSKLCDEALANQQFRISPIEYPTDVYPEEAPVDDDEEVSADIADTVAPTADDEEDDDYQLSRKEVKKEESKDTRIIESTIDPNAWKVEVEKVAPLLKMRMDTDNKEWRTHLEHTKELQGNIQTKVPMAQDNLAKLSETISQAIEAIRSREKTINSQYKKEVTEYSEVQEQLQEVMKRFDERNREVSTLESSVQQISEQLDQIKSLSDERGESMTDTGPLNRLKKSMKTIKEEMREMDLRLGTVSHNLLHIKMAQSNDKGNRRNKPEDDDEDD